MAVFTVDYLDTLWQMPSSVTQGNGPMGLSQGVRHGGKR